MSTFNRRQRRKFNQLPDDQKEAFIQHLVIDKVSGVMNKEITKSMIVGMDMVWTQLYEDCVNPLDNVENEAEWNRKVGELLSLIRTQYLRIEANKAKENQTDAV